MILSKEGKIKINPSGEVLRKSDALIDLRSTYDLNKTGSLVNYAKLYNNPSQVFRDNGSLCEENGDGFDFTNNVSGNLDRSTLPDISGDFFMGWWGKYTQAPTFSTSLFTLGADFSSGNRGPSLYLAKDNGAIVINPDGTTTVGEVIRIFVDYLDWNYFSAERINGTIYWCRNGAISHFTVGYSTTINYQGNRIQFGNTGGINNQPNNGNLDDISVIPKAIHNYIGKTYYDQVFTPPKRSSE